MIKNKKIIKIVKNPIFIFSFAIIIVLIYYHFSDSHSLKKISNAITFSIDSGYYNDTIEIKLKKDINLPIGTKIYYTLNGNDPTKDDNEYNDKIILTKENDFSLYPLKAVAYYNDSYSLVYEHDYIIGSNLLEEMDLPIVSITSDSNNLYSYEQGIMIAGITYDENYEKNSSGYIRGNYNNRGEEWIRESNITFFDSNGNVLFEQKCGLGISGGTSASLDTKSLKLSFDIYDKYHDTTKFKMDFYDPGFSSEYSLVDEYNNLRLKMGSDIENGTIRSSIMSRLATESGFDGATTTKRAIVYLNGEFYGIADIQPTYSPSYLAKKYSLDDSEKIDKSKGGEKNLLKKYGVLEYFDLDLNIPENRDILEKYIDMDNFLLYYALEILMDNPDWPINNMEVWKYTGEYDGYNKYTDGRIRFLMYDSDWIFRSPGYYSWSYKEVFDAIMCDNADDIHVSVFKKLMNSTYYRDKFLNIVLDLFNTSFDKNNLLDIVTQERRKVRFAFKSNYKLSTYKEFTSSIGEILSEVSEKETVLSKLFKKYFGVSKKYTANIKSGSGVEVLWNNMHLYQNESYQNEYYKNTEFVLSYKEYPGYSFKYWLVNGKEVYDDILIIDGSLNNYSIEAIADYKENNNHLVISEISASGSLDWIKITNTGKESVDISDYYLTDNSNYLKKYRLPNTSLESSESITIYGEKYEFVIDSYKSNLSLSVGKRLILSHNDEIIDKIVIPYMSEIESFSRFDNSGTFLFSK